MSRFANFSKGDIDYELWLERADRHLKSKARMSAFDLPNHDWRGDFDKGTAASDAAFNAYIGRREHERYRS